MKIYTKTGDDGTTGLFAGPRVEKDHPRIEAYGAIDELNAVLGVVLACSEPQRETSPLQLTNWIPEVQGDLFSMGAELATPRAQQQGMCLLKPTDVEKLETWIDQAEAHLPALTSFVLPGGCQAAAWLHLARTVCRRAERQLVSLAREPDVSVGELLIMYVNRLSDLLFVVARLANTESGVPDSPWNRPD